MRDKILTNGHKKAGGGGKGAALVRICIASTPTHHHVRGDKDLDLKDQ